MTSSLALRGGAPVRRTPLPAYNTIGAEEKRAAMEVLESGNLSQFLGTWSPDFLGGPRVHALERAWEEHFNVPYAVSVNSATSGLFAALGAARIGPGDEVVTSPYTMSASAAGAFIYGATPVFADIDPETYCITADTVRKVLSPRTKAIVAVDLFGHPCDFAPIMELARERGITVIEDAAQASGATYHGRPAGTLADIGVFSLNYHKIIHSGEGGVIVTADEDLADRLRLIRNHAEAVVEAKGTVDLTNLVGFNYRMTEIEAAIAREQLRKLPGLVEYRQEAASFLGSRLREVPGLTPATVQAGCTHAYYVLAVQYEASVVGAPRSTFVEAVRAEGIPLAAGYVKPLYLQPLYQRGGFPGRSRPARSYPPGLCPVTERLHQEGLFYIPHVHAGMSKSDLDDVATAIEKVAANAKELPQTSNSRRPEP